VSGFEVPASTQVASITTGASERADPSVGRENARFPPVCALRLLFRPHRRETPDRKLLRVVADALRNSV